MLRLKSNKNGLANCEVVSQFKQRPRRKCRFGASGKTAWHTHEALSPKRLLGHRFRVPQLLGAGLLDFALSAAYLEVLHVLMFGPIFVVNRMISRTSRPLSCITRWNEDEYAARTIAWQAVKSAESWVREYCVVWEKLITSLLMLSLGSRLQTQPRRNFQGWTVN